MDNLTITVDTADLLAAIDALPEAVLAKTKAAAEFTAHRIADEARSRVARRTGRTAGKIHVEEAHDGSGFVVLPWATLETVDEQSSNLPMWLEFGTKFMTARPYFFIAARLEEGAHDRRMREAIQEAIDEKGLGE